MPSRDPFTRLCQKLSRPPAGVGADLHVHTTHSDGEAGPAEVVALACRAGLTALAVTDHDTLSGYAEAAAAAEGTGLEVVSGVEITSTFQEREIHILGYFVAADDPALNAALARIREGRLRRFEAMAERLRGFGLSIPDEELRALTGRGGTLGRRHLAALLVRSGQVRSVNEAFQRYLTLPALTRLPKERLPAAEAIRLIREAGGVASWAHPPSDGTAEQVRELRALGLRALEAEYPFPTASHRQNLRTLAAELELAVSGGSDFHAPQPGGREIGSCGITRIQLDQLKSFVSCH